MDEGMLAELAAGHPLREAFLGWQCRVRQLAMRAEDGRPGAAITPALWRMGEPLGQVITLISKRPGFSVTAELEHIAAKTHDPAERRREALRFLSASHYQKPRTFSDVLTATFPPASASALAGSGGLRLVFDALGQRYDLAVEAARLGPGDPLHRATLAHNRLFNPALPPGTEVIGFAPDWAASSGPG